MRVCAIHISGKSLLHLAYLITNNIHLNNDDFWHLSCIQTMKKKSNLWFFKKINLFGHNDKFQINSANNSFFIYSSSKMEYIVCVYWCCLIFDFGCWWRCVVSFITEKYYQPYILILLTHLMPPLVLYTTSTFTWM